MSPTRSPLSHPGGAVYNPDCAWKRELYQWDDYNKVESSVKRHLTLSTQINQSCMIIENPNYDGGGVKYVVVLRLKQSDRTYTQPKYKVSIVHFYPDT